MPTLAQLAKKIESLEELLNEKLDSLIDDLVSKVNIKLKDLGLGEHASLCESVRFISQEFDEMKLRQEDLLASNKVLLSRNEALEERVADLEQYSRMNNVEIKGVPSSQGEDCVAIVRRIGDAVECPVSPADIDTVHRVSSKTTEKSIIARFCSRDKKMSSLGRLAEPDCALTISASLVALALKKEHKWKRLWTDNCQIKARKADDSRVYRISTESDLLIFT